MASTASDLLKLELQGTGDNSGTWGTKANVLFERMEESIAETLSISLASLGGAGYTLDDTQYVKNSGTTGESHVAALKFTGTLTGNEEVLVPARNKTYWVWNATSGAFTVTMNISGGAGVTVPQGAISAVIADGTNVEVLTIPVTNAGDINMNGRSILDTNGNELITFTETASAVNQVKVGNAATGNAPTITAEGGDTNVSINLVPKGTGVVQQNGTAVGLTGVHTISVPAIAMVAQTTAGAASGTSETTTNKVMFATYDFDAATQEHVQFTIQMPKSWNEGTVTASFVWSHAATTTNFGVVWGIQAVAMGDGDAGDAAFGTAQTVTDTGGTTDDIYITADTSAMTIAGTPAAEDFVVFRVYRAAAADTLAVDARLHQVNLYYTTDAGNDA